MERQADEQADAEGNILKDRLQLAESEVESSNDKLSNRNVNFRQAALGAQTRALFMCKHCKPLWFLHGANMCKLAFVTHRHPDRHAV